MKYDGHFICHIPKFLSTNQVHFACKAEIIIFYSHFVRAKRVCYIYGERFNYTHINGCTHIENTPFFNKNHNKHQIIFGHYFIVFLTIQTIELLTIQLLDQV